MSSLQQNLRKGQNGFCLEARGMVWTGRERRTGGRKDPNNVYTYDYMNKEKKRQKIKRRRRRRDNKEGDEPNQGVLYIYMEMSQYIPLYNNYVGTDKNVF
jgi:hypothetical protein